MKDRPFSFFVPPALTFQNKSCKFCSSCQTFLFSLEDAMEINDLTHTIIGCAYKVHNILGFGFVEKCYENALKIEMDKLGIHALQQDKVNVWYEEHLVGFFVPDLWLPETLIIEVKSVQNIPKEHEVMLVNYLTATKINDGLLINFGPSVQVKRKFREYKPKGTILDAPM